MNKQAFMQELEYRLRHLTDDDRLDALEYYSEYIKDDFKNIGSLLRHLKHSLIVSMKKRPSFHHVMKYTVLFAMLIMKI